MMRIPLKSPSELGRNYNFMAEIGENDIVLMGIATYSWLTKEKPQDTLNSRRFL
jgi:hypothetical protein